MKHNNFFILSSSPLSQFEITDIFNINILNYINLNLTNIGLYLTIAGTIVLTISILATNNQKLIANNWSIGKETLYATIHSIVINQIDSKKGQLYFPFIYTLFIFIL